MIAQTRALLQNSELQAAFDQHLDPRQPREPIHDQTAPFKLAKDPSKAERLDEVLYNLVEVCRILAVLLWPFIPQTAGKMFAQLGVPGTPHNFEAARWGVLGAGHNVGSPSALFPKKED